MKEIEANIYIEKRELNIGLPSIQYCGSYKKTSYNV